MLLLTGCTQHVTINVTYQNLPENSYMFLLVRPVEEKTWQRDIPDYIKGTELENYNRDGWVTYLESDMVFVSNTNDNVIEIAYGNGESNDDIRAFCYKFKEICFAVMNDNGKLLYITSTLDLLPSDRFGCPKYVTYDAKTDKFHINGIVENTICGYTLSGWWLLITFLSWITDIGFISILNKSLKNNDKEYLTNRRIPLILLALPGAVGIILGIISLTVPYFGGSCQPVQIIKSLVEIIILNPFFVAGMISLPVALHHRSKLQ